MLCPTCMSIVDNLRKPKEWLRHHKNLFDLERSMRARCSWCLKLWEKCDAELPSSQNIVCDLRVILDQVRERLLLNFYASKAADPSFDKHFKGLKLLLQPENENSGTYPNRRLSDSTFSRESYEFATRWLNKCLREHDACRPQARSRALPARLIQIGPPGTSLNPCLVETDQLPLSTEYIALSHCWGTESFYCLKKSNLHELKQGIPFQRLSKVFQDAIYVLRRFGMRYIWIDSLCIIQDKIEDWQVEAAKMGEIYRHSFCNIAATGFQDGRNGLFVRRDPLFPRTERISINADILWQDGTPFMRRGVYTCIDFGFWKDEVSDAPLNRRAWVVQERLLSPRTLHFGSNQLLWECYESEACESFSDGVPAKVLTFKVKQNLLLELIPKEDRPELSDEEKIRLYSSWSDLVSVYTIGSLSHKEDKLVAISGLAKRFKELSQDEYLAGLWKWNFVHHLLWEALPEGAWGRSFTRRSDKYCAPSWSWASIDGDIMPWDPVRSRYTDYHTFAEVLEVKVTTVNNILFGQVENANLKIRAPFVKAAMFIVEEFNYVPMEISHREYFFIVSSGTAAHVVRIVVCADVTQSKDTHAGLVTEDVENSENPIHNPGTLGPEIVWGVARLTCFLPIRAKVVAQGVYCELEGLILEEDILSHIHGQEQYKRIGKFEIKDQAECTKFLSSQLAGRRLPIAYGAVGSPHEFMETTINII